MQESRKDIEQIARRGPRSDEDKVDCKLGVFMMLRLSFEVAALFATGCLNVWKSPHMKGQSDCFENTVSRGTLDRGVTAGQDALVHVVTLYRCLIGRNS